MAVLASAWLAVAGGAATAQSGGDVLAITDAMIFDATGKEPFRGTVIIRGERIAEVGTNLKVPAGAKVLRANGRALLPGFIDVHTHWAPAGSPGTLPQIASAYIKSGVTTVNDFHQQPEAFEVRRSWLTTLAAPHVNFVARLSTPGGHGADWGDTNTTKWVATPESARREIKALQAYRPDYIKVFADGWRYGQQPEETSMNLETMTALVDEAHKHGQRVLTHTVTVDHGKLAARADVDVIAHSIQDGELDAEAIGLIKQAGTHYAPTLAIYQLKPDEMGPNRKDDAPTRLRIRKWGYALNNVRALHKAGVTIAAGTDAGIGGAAHGISTLQEIELLVDAGLSPRDALRAATGNGAMALGLLDDRGTIEKGKRADLVLINGKPWDTIADVRKIDGVFVNGRQVFGGDTKWPKANEATALAPSPAAAVIDDFERADGRSTLDTLRLVDMDGGMDRSIVVTNTVPHPGGGKALGFAVQMATKDKPEGGIIVPLRRGSVQPVDVRAFQGIRIDLRGAGRYQIVINTLSGKWTTEIDGDASWAEIRVPFSRLVPVGGAAGTARQWHGDDVLQVGVIAQRAAGESAWGEIDNLGLY